VTTQPKPTFTGTTEEQKIAEEIFDLMILQGRSYAMDAPIRQSLSSLVAYYVDRRLRRSPEDVQRLIERALERNSHVFYREERDGQVVYVTTKRGSYTPVRRSTGVPHLPVVTTRHMQAGPPAATPTGPRPTLLKRETLPIVDGRSPRREPSYGADYIREQIVVRRPEPSAPGQQPGVSPVAPPPPSTTRRPELVTPQGIVIDMSQHPIQILEIHRDFFANALRERLSADPRIASFGDEWFLEERLTLFTKGELRRIREFIESVGGPEDDASIISELFGKSPSDADYLAFRFSLNYQLSKEKKDFEFVGTARHRLWWLAGTPSPRISRGPLKPGEIGQDLKYLEDEPALPSAHTDRWEHVLTYYEIENGILPYEPAAKGLLPAPFLKDQRIVQLQFRVPQVGAMVYAELHYPTGNRGGWIDGLGDLLAAFVPGARLTITRTDDDTIFNISYTPTEPRQINTLAYDTKRQRFIFEPVEINYAVDENSLLEKERFKGLNNARRLDENSRRKGDPVIMYAFEKVGTKTTEGAKTIYRASIADLLPIINIEKPFSVTSLVRFFVTHPHYKADSTHEGVYLYVEEQE